MITNVEGDAIPYELSHNTQSVLLKLENKMDREISYFNYNSKHYNKCKFALKRNSIWTVSNLFQLEFVQNVNVANFVYYA